MERKMMTFICALVLFVLQSETLQAQQSMLDGNPVWVYEQEVEWFTSFSDSYGE